MAEGIVRFTAIFEEGSAAEDAYELTPQEQAIGYAKAASQMHMSWSIDAVDPSRVQFVCEVVGEVEPLDGSLIVDDPTRKQLEAAYEHYSNRLFHTMTDAELIDELGSAIDKALGPRGMGNWGWLRWDQGKYVYISDPRVPSITQIDEPSVEGIMPSIDIIWKRIEEHVGETFRQKRGNTFTYEVRGNTLIPDRTNQALPRGEFEKAMDRLPLAGPGEIQDLRGPSYVYAILMDPRIRGNDW